MRVSIHRLLTHRAIVVATFARPFWRSSSWRSPRRARWPLPASTGSDRPTGIDVSGNGDEIVRAGGDVVVRAGETVDSVTVFGGDAVVAGTVRHSVVAVGGDVVLRSSARVGTLMKPDDATVFAIGGTTRTAPGAIVTGTTGAWEDVSGGEALVAAAVAMTGMIMVGAAIIAALAVGLLTVGTLVGVATLIAAFIWLIVWLVRRDAGRPFADTGGGYPTVADVRRRRTGGVQTQPLAGTYGQPTPETQGTAATQATNGPAFTVPPRRLADDGRIGCGGHCRRRTRGNRRRAGDDLRHPPRTRRRRGWNGTTMSATTHPDVARCRGASRE